MTVKSLKQAAATLVLGTVVLCGPFPAQADEYDSTRAGHPLRVVAYALHPVGALADFLIFRPTHWVGSWRPIAVLFGHELTPEELDDPSPHDHAH